MSSYKGLDLFGSGPHRFRLPPMGQQVQSRSAFGAILPGVDSIGAAQVVVAVNGRLTAFDHDQLRERLDDLRIQLELWPTAGVLVSNTAFSWNTMSFARFAPAELIDRGREVSLAYEALFIRRL